MSDLARFGGVHALGSADGQTVLARHGITTRRPERARTRYQRAESLTVGTLIGVNGRGLVGATRRWTPPFTVLSVG
jgi:hypothetical protein